MTSLSGRHGQNFEPAESQVHRVTATREEIILSLQERVAECSRASLAVRRVSLMIGLLHNGTQQITYGGVQYSVYERR